MIKKCLLLIFVLFFSACSKNQVVLEQKIDKEQEIKKEEQLKNELILTIKDIANLIKNDNIDLINSKYINSKVGAYEIYKDEETKELVYKHIVNIEEIDDYVASLEPKEEEIKFNCNAQTDKEYGWNKDGLFFSKKNDLKFFEKIKSLTNIKDIEKYSYELIITNNATLVLAKIENNWYILAIDTAKTDCM